MTVAVLDACVLFPAALRDLWMHLTVRFVFHPKWTAEIQDEWVQSVLEKRPDLQAERLARTTTLMAEAGRDWQVPDFQAVIPSLALPDPDDRHVLAAAIAAGAPLIVTFNLADFPDYALCAHNVRAVHPDVFACELLEAKPLAFLLAVRTHRASLRNPPATSDDYLESLRRLGLARTVANLELQKDQL